MSGVLYGVGLGPGDPELVTRKAWRLILEARIIAYPAPDTGPSFARAIAAEAINPEAEEIPIIIPMRAERFPAQAIYDEAAARIAARLETGADVVTLCEGDPFFYGSYMYLHERLCARFECQVIPGVTSLTACAAALGRPLTARHDGLTIIPATLPEEDLRARLARVEAAAIMKIGRHLPKIRRVLAALDLTERAGYVARASLPNQHVCKLAEAPDSAPYFSMILIYKGGEAWLM